MKTLRPMLWMCAAGAVAGATVVHPALAADLSDDAVLAPGTLDQPALAADLSDDAVLAPGTLDRQRPLRRMVGRRLAADSPLAPGSVKKGTHAINPCPPEILPPGAATSLPRR